MKCLKAELIVFRNICKQKQLNSEMCVNCKWYSIVTQRRIWYNLIKAARKADTNAGLARAFGDINK